MERIIEERNLNWREA